MDLTEPERTGTVTKIITPDVFYRVVRGNSKGLRFEIRAHALRATASINALDHEANIFTVKA